MTQKPNINKVIAELCKRSLYKFFIEFWEVIEADKLMLNPHIKVLCDEAQRIAEGVIRGDKVNDDLMVNICPGTSKSTIFSIMLPAWIWVNKPDCITLCNTISASNATKFAQKFRDIVSSEKYTLYFPHIKLRGDSTALNRVQNTLGGARRQYTTKSRITGDHGHIRIDDDPMAYQDALSDAQVEICIDGYKAFSTREKKNAFVPYMLVMQRLSKQDTASYVETVKPNIKKICLPAWDNGKIYPPELKEIYTDGILAPTHINTEFLVNKKKGLGDKQYMAEYGQDCEMTEGYMYEVQKTKTIENKGLSIAVCDPADDGECYLSSVFATIYNNRVWVKDIVYTQKDSNHTIPVNIEKAKQHKPFAFFIEKDGMGSIYAKQVLAGYPLVKSFNAKGNKDERIHGKSNIISKYFLFLEESPNMEYENAVNHMTNFKRIGQNKYKDFEDALTSLADIVIKNNLINIYLND